MAVDLPKNEEKNKGKRNDVKTRNFVIDFSNLLFYFFILLAVSPLSFTNITFIFGYNF